MQLNSLLTRLYKTFQKNPLYFVYLPLVIYWIFLFIMTTIPQDKLPHFFDYQDKVEHFFAYLILAFFLMLSLHFQKKNMHISKKSFLFTIIFLLIYATIDELHQIYVPGRYCDFIDWLADMSGGIFGVVLSYYFVKVSNIDIRN